MTSDIDLDYVEFELAFDLLSPSIAAGARQGVGLGAGFRLIGFGPA